MNLFPWQGKKLRTVWRVEKNGSSGILVGTAHFSPYSFETSLRRLMRGAEIVFFEGPLDQESMAEVTRYGSQGRETPSLYAALGPDVIKGINGLLALQFQQTTTVGSYLKLFVEKPTGFLESHARGVRPWFAFFTIWTAFLNWRHSMDVEAFQIARELGKDIAYLETIPDQLQALDGIPLERIVRYCNLYQHWPSHRELFSRLYLAGKLEKHLSVTAEFPTRCEAIIARRDPVFFQGIRTALDKGPTTAFVGVGHIPGLLRLFLADGYRVIQGEPC